MAHTQARDMWMALRFGDLEVNISAEGVSYSPDVAHDMIGHLIRGFTEAITELRSHGVIGAYADTDDDDGDETDEEETEDE